MFGFSPWLAIYLLMRALNTRVRCKNVPDGLLARWRSHRCLFHGQCSVLSYLVWSIHFLFWTSSCSMFSVRLAYAPYVHIFVVIIIICVSVYWMRTIFHIIGYATMSNDREQCENMASWSSLIPCLFSSPQRQLIRAIDTSALKSIRIWFAAHARSEFCRRYGTIRPRWPVASKCHKC